MAIVVMQRTFAASEPCCSFTSVVFKFWTTIACSQCWATLTDNVLVASHGLTTIARRCLGPHSCTILRRRALFFAGRSRILPVCPKQMCLPGPLAMQVAKRVPTKTTIKHLILLTGDYPHLQCLRDAKLGRFNSCSVPEQEATCIMVSDCARSI